jgi:hypothetical protein
LCIDQPFTPLIITEAEIGLCFHTTQRGVTGNTSASSGIIQFIAIFGGAEAAIRTMSIKVNGIAGRSYVPVIKRTHPPIRTEIAEQLIIGRRLEALYEGQALFS